MTTITSITTPIPQIKITIEKQFPTAVIPTNRVLEVAAMFGLGVDQTRNLKIIPPTHLTLTGQTITFITGPSGSGKSTILNLIKEKIPQTHFIDFQDHLNHNPEIDHQPIIETLGKTLHDATRILSIAGLADAFIMLRTPNQLSDGQRYRLALARIINQIETTTTTIQQNTPIVILADEFGAALDRLTASMIARNIRRYVNTNPNLAFIVATTHEDLLKPLAPDTLIYKPLDESIQIIHRPSTSHQQQQQQ